MEISGPCDNRKQIRQSVSVPFIWEEKPGTPKKDWKPSTSTVKSAVPADGPPLKLVPSTPLKWEEKPGKPLPCFSQPPSPPPPPPPQLQIQLPPKELVALPCTGDQNFVSQQQSPLSPDADTESTTSSSSRSYTTTGRTSSSLVGPSFLHRLFPLLPPHQHPDFRDKLGCSETGTNSSWDAPLMAIEIAGSKFLHCESNCSAVNPVRRPRTAKLGELIMMSRRRSSQTIALQLRTHNSGHSLSISKLIPQTPTG